VLIFVDCEASGPCPSRGVLTEFGAVEYVPLGDPRRELKPSIKTFGAVAGLAYELTGVDYGSPVGRTFHGRIYGAHPDPKNPKASVLDSPLTVIREAGEVFRDFDAWLEGLHPRGGVTFVSDNPAFDWQWVCDGLWRHVGRNRFGHSARRIGDFYAGLTGDHSNTQRWKRLRVTPHDHDPVHDAAGNAEAFDRMLRGERA
jgi:hypothetical protein